MEFLIPIAIFVVLVGGFLALQVLNRRRIERRPGDAAADSEDPIPSTAHQPDDGTPLGDSAELHDEITPHDLPAGHPGRGEAERRAGDTPGATTTGG